MRLIDDKIVYALNTSIPTASFKEKIDPTSKCKELYHQVIFIGKTCVDHCTILKLFFRLKKPTI